MLKTTLRPDPEAGLDPVEQEPFLPKLSALVNPNVRHRRLAVRWLPVLPAALVSLLLFWFATRGGWLRQSPPPLRSEVATVYTDFKIADRPSNLLDLGQDAEDAYNLQLTDREYYLSTLHDFIENDAPNAFKDPMRRSLQEHFQTASEKTAMHNADPAAMRDYRTIFQTDKTKPDEGDHADVLSKKWAETNPDWNLAFYDDDAALRWVSDAAGESAIEWAFKRMRRGVLKADFWRYLVVLLSGGVYSDVDTVPLAPIDTWGSHNATLWDIARSDGEHWRPSIAVEPSVIVAVDVDVHEIADWHKWWPRPLGICQWTLSGAPHHPIFIDVTRRVINATRYVDEQVSGPLVEELRQVELRIKEVAITEDGSRQEVQALEEEAKRLRHMVETEQGVLPVMDHTGPGVWTDAVLSYLLVRYGVSWQDLRGLSKPLRIGEVLVLPITAFSPGGTPDFGAHDASDIQACVLHDFRGSWKGDGL